MNHKIEMVSASGVPIVLESKQVLNDRGLVIGQQSEIILRYGDGGNGKKYTCQDTIEAAVKREHVLVNFLNDKTINGKPIKGERDGE